MNEMRELKEQPVEYNSSHSCSDGQPSQSPLFNDCYDFYAPSSKAKDATGTSQMPVINDCYDFYAPNSKAKDTTGTEDGAKPAPGSSGQKTPEGKDNDKPPTDETTYQVVPGDTLWGIATRNLQKGSSTPPSDADIVGEVNTIAQKNNIANPDLIYAGATIRLPGHPTDDKPPTNDKPPTDETTYQVVSGDTLWGIATRTLQNGSTASLSDADIVGEVNKISQLNNIANPDLIYSGQTIRLPHGDSRTNDGGPKPPPENQPQPPENQPQPPENQPQPPENQPQPPENQPQPPENQPQPGDTVPPDFLRDPALNESGKRWRAGGTDFVHGGGIAPGFFRNVDQPNQSNDQPGPYDWSKPNGANGGADSSQGGNANAGNDTRGADNQGQNVPPDALAAVSRDQATRSKESFDAGVDSLVSLGLTDEQSLLALKQNWLGQEKQKNPLEFMRGVAEIADGLGQARLQQGSWIIDPNLPDTNERVLQGYNLDFGGKATESLRLAAGELVNTQQYVQGHKGQVIEGQAMDDAYQNQLHDLQTEVESKLNIVYGAHPIDEIYDFIRQDVRNHAGPWQQELHSMKDRLQDLLYPAPLPDGRPGQPCKDNRYIAKCARDLALGYLAEADYISSQGNGEDARLCYQDARDSLNYAMKNDGGAPDNQDLQEICASLAPAINKATDGQWKDPFANPFSIPEPPNNHV